MRCNCESSHCNLHDAGSCTNTATVECEYIGGVCSPCAAIMSATGGGSYLGHSLAELHDRTASIGWRRGVEESLNRHGIVTRSEAGTLLPAAVTAYQAGQVTP